MPSKVEKMRETLLQAIEQVKAGTLDPTRAKAMAALAHQVNASLDVELQVLIAAKATPAALPLVKQVDDAEQANGPRAIRTGVVERVGGVTRHSIGD